MPKNRTVPVANPNRVKISAAWGTPTVEKFTTESGQEVVIKRPGVEGLIRSGIAAELDTLSSISQQLVEAAGGEGEVTEENFKGEVAERSADMLAVVDKVLVFALIDPKVELTPENYEDRDLSGNTIYADQIPLNDKMAIFTKVMDSTSGLETFREGSPESVAAVPAVEDVALPAV